MNAPKQARQAFQEVLGKKQVEWSDSTCKTLAQATFPTDQQIWGVLYPKNKNEVAACLKIANQYKVALYPISRGKNWGYGSCVPPETGAFILSLATWDQIIEFDPRLAYVKIEPGVSFAQLNAFLREKGGKFEVQGPGSTDQASVIGNTLERGISGGFGGSRAAQVSALEVLLPNGELLQTGFGNFTASKAAPVHPWGVGPCAKELFFQSNLGIVLSMTVQLCPIPVYQKKGIWSIADTDDLIQSIDNIRELRLAGLLKGNCAFHNIPKALSFGSQYPYEATRGVRPLPKDFQSIVEKEFGGKWMGELSLGSADEGIFQRKQELLTEKLPGLSFVEHEKNTNPSREVGGIAHAYWRKMQAISHDSNPVRDACGLLWHCPVLPLIGQEIASLCESVSEIMRSHGFDPMISIQIQASRYAILVLSIVYDRKTSGEDQAAQNCYQALLDATEKKGYYPYRAGIQHMKRLNRQKSDHSFWAAMKARLDPNQILAPGRYIKHASSQCTHSQT